MKCLNGMEIQAIFKNEKTAESRKFGDGRKSEKPYYPKAGNAKCLKRKIEFTLQ